ncbi:MAG: efflux RND transporter permease subunit [Pirellulales bacterium]
MKSLIRWAIRNSPAMNTLMIGLMAVGLFSMFTMRREVFPEFDLEIVLVSVVYPGASPSEIEEGICQKIEEAVRPIAGIKKQTSVAQEGAGHVILELQASVPDVQKILNEVRSEVDRIPSMPPLAEDPEVKQITLRTPAIRVGVVGPESERPGAELELRELTERVRDDLLQLPSISQANIIGAKEYQIDIEIAEDTLRKHGLSLQQVAQIVRRENIELPGGTIKTDSQEVLLRGKNRRLIGEEIANIPLVTQPGGVVLTVGDLGVVRDEFADSTAISRINGQPGLVISIDRTMSEDLLTMVEEANQYLETKQLPPGYSFMTWADASVDVRDRLDLLARNGTQGLILVFIVLAIFLDLRLAFWVALGIPISILGACGYLLYADQTLNMLSMFAFLMALGIIVDDAIVVGENVYERRQRGEGYIEAAVNGTYEVLPSVIASVVTTIIAFVPLLFVSGVMGKFIAVMPVAIIAMLIISLFESTFILPCHLAHERGLLFIVLEYLLYPFRFVAAIFRWINVRTQRLLAWIIDRGYRPTMRWSLNHPAAVVCAALALLMVSAGFIRAGITPFVLFPKLDNKAIEARITYPDGTPARVTEAATRRLQEAIEAVDRRHSPRGKSLIVVRHRAVGEVSTPGIEDPNSRASGSHVGNVYVELVDTSQREVVSQEVIAMWRREAGEFPGAESVTFGSPEMGPGGAAIEFKLMAPPANMDQLEAAVAEAKSQLAEYPGVFDIIDDSSPGKWEFQLTIKEKAKALGIPLADLAETVRASYYGEEVMRLQRGRHEVKLMVRYPREDRRSLAEFHDIRVRTSDGTELPLTELADVRVQRGYSEINRVEQLRAITITADVEESIGNASQIVTDMQAGFIDELQAKHPSVRVLWEGQQEQSIESFQSLAIGLVVAILAMFVLLTLEFRSYLQPLLILSIIPFGAIGAVAGHALLGLPLTLFSLFGLVALTGVVVNDSIVLIDFINHRAERGEMGLKDALLDAGCRRFRPVLLTSMTTIAGLLPILTERSFQAQILIPMAASLCFGLLVATALVLVLIPTFYYVYARAIELMGAEVLAAAEAGNAPAAPSASEPAATLQSDLDDAEPPRAPRQPIAPINGNGEHGDKLPLPHGERAGERG